MQHCGALPRGDAGELPKENVRGCSPPNPSPKGRSPFGIPYWGIDNSIDIEKRPATLTAWAGLWGYAVLSFYPAAAIVTGHWPAGRAQGPPLREEGIAVLYFYP